MLIILLDEMNLARIEHYFSDMLSKLETRRSIKDNSSPEEKIRASVLLDTGESVPHQLFLGKNILFIGTFNQDESTLEVSDKVYDRANVISFPRPDCFADAAIRMNSDIPDSALQKSDWESWCQHNGSDRFKEELREVFREVNNSLSYVNRGVGHRVFQATLRYITLYPYSSENNKEKKLKELESYSDQISMKILPKLKGLDTQDPAANRCLEGIEKLLPAELKNAFDKARKMPFFDWNGAPLE